VPAAEPRAGRWAARWSYMARGCCSVSCAACSRSTKSRAWWSFAVRRYECQRCGAVMTVVPAGMLARRQYSASSIALTLHLA
jgi:Zn ribbon nucleic-acid-binding protein